MERDEGVYGENRRDGMSARGMEKREAGDSGVRTTEERVSMKTRGEDGELRCRDLASIGAEDMERCHLIYGNV